MIKSIFKAVGKSYLLLCGLVVATVLTAYVILLGMIAFVKIVVPG